MTGVADTTPLNYLVLIEAVEVLPKLFEQILIPPAVLEELNHPDTPAQIREWLLQTPRWLDVRTAPEISIAGLQDLDPGEREAVQLALTSGADVLLMDEAEGRRVARSLHLQVSGTLGLLERASRLGMLDLGDKLKKLEQTNFRVSEALRLEIRRRNGL